MIDFSRGSHVLIPGGPKIADICFQSWMLFGTIVIYFKKVKTPTVHQFHLSILNMYVFYIKTFFNAMHIHCTSQELNCKKRNDIAIMYLIQKCVLVVEEGISISIIGSSWRHSRHIN